MQRARREGGFQRAIIYRGDDEGTVRAYEINEGQQTEFAPDELHIAEQDSREERRSGPDF